MPICLESAVSHQRQRSEQKEQIMFHKRPPKRCSMTSKKWLGAVWEETRQVYLSKVQTGLHKKVFPAKSHLALRRKSISIEVAKPDGCQSVVFALRTKPEKAANQPQISSKIQRRQCSFRDECG